MHEQAAERGIEQRDERAELFFVPEPLYSLVLPHIASMVRRTALHARLSLNASLCCLFVHFWMKKRAREIFGSLSPRFSLLLAAYPALFLFIQLTGERALFPYGIPSGQSRSLLLFFLILCVSLLLLYMLTLNSTAQIVKRKQTEEELTFARQMISKQREHYNQTLDYIEQVRIIRHDFRHNDLCGAV